MITGPGHRAEAAVLMKSLRVDSGENSTRNVSQQQSSREPVPISPLT
jgi:hypothetical protein